MGRRHEVEAVRLSRIAVDWDATLCEETWPEIGDWLPGAKEALYKLAHMYDEVVIHTLRVAPVELDDETPRDNGDQILAINIKLAQARMPLNVYVWDKPYKPPCEFFIDDRNIPFDGDWDKALATVAVRRVTNHQEETVEEAPLWIDQDVKLCAPSIHADPGDEQPEVRRTEIAQLIEPYPQPSTPGAEWVYAEEPVWTPPAPVRTFETGATRDTDQGKLDYEGFLSPLVLHRFAEYMHENRIQSDGSLRSSDNWQKGIPFDAYMKSGWRHFMDWWMAHRIEDFDVEFLEVALCALIFNAQGYLHELLQGKVPGEVEEAA